MVNVGNVSVGVGKTLQVVDGIKYKALQAEFDAYKLSSENQYSDMLTEKDEQISNLQRDYEDLLSNAIDPMEYDSMKAQYEERIEQIEQERDSYRSEKEYMNQELGYYRENCMEPFIAATLFDCRQIIGNPTDFHLPNDLRKFRPHCFEGITMVEIRSEQLPPNIEEIGDYAFKDTNLEDVEISDTKIKKIGVGAFYNCKFNSITLPSTIESIGRDAFTLEPYIRTSYAKTLKLTCLATTPPSVEYQSLISCKAIYVPSECLSAYKNADGWKAYSSLISGI